MKTRFFLPLLFACSTMGLAQKNESFYRLPNHIQKSEYSQTSILVKWKTAKKQPANGRSGFSVPGVAILGVKGLAPAHVAKQNASWRGPVKSQSRIDIGMYERITLLPGQDIESVINKLYETGNFELVEPEFAHKMSYTPNDPRKNEQYYLDLIKAYQAWDVTKGSESVVIAIIDSGGDLDHPDLAANIYSNPDEIAGNGIDDDNDGYVDNKNGWDFV
jgi:serine protease